LLPPQLLELDRSQVAKRHELGGTLGRIANISVIGKAAKVLACVAAIVLDNKPISRAVGVMTFPPRTGHIVYAALS
jgi:hypothetical protein